LGELRHEVTTMQRFSILIALSLAACGGSVQQQPDAAPPDIDAAIDAAVDAAPPSGTTQLELTGGARMTGGTLVVDMKLTPIKP
jgi:hypothetical protein